MLLPIQLILCSGQNFQFDSWRKACVTRVTRYVELALLYESIALTCNFLDLFCWLDLVTDPNTLKNSCWPLDQKQNQ